VKRAMTIALLLLPACKLDFQRMLSQRRVNEASDDPARIELLEKSSPLEGAVAHVSPETELQPGDGCEGPRYTESLPVRPSAELVAQGRGPFVRVCAACHGTNGNGISPVALAMERTRPPSLLLPPVRDYPAGRIFRTVMFGYKLMPSYREDLSVHDGWAVTAYVQSLIAGGGGDPGSVAAAVSAGPACPGESP
jgi:mono/diheme cytochrome c family protein